MPASPRRLEADDTAGPVKAIELNKGSLVDEIPKGTDFKKLFADEKFMQERVTIILHPSQDDSEIGLPVSVNGKRVYMIPGRQISVPRTHIAQLMKARPDIVSHRSDDPSVREAELNRMTKRSTSKYNFDVIEDTARGIAWLRELRQHTYQK